METDAVGEPLTEWTPDKNEKVAARSDWRTLLLGAMFFIAVAFTFSYVMSENPQQEDLSANGSGFTGTLFDNFDRAENDAGLNGAGNDDWTSVRGGWATQVGVAYLPLPDPELNLAIVDIGSDDVSISALVGGLGPCGVAVRYTDAENYVALVRVPGYGVWNVVDVAGGSSTVVGKVGDVSENNVDVKLSIGDDVITVTVGGREFTYVRSTGGTGTGVGLVAQGDGGVCAWDNVAAQVAS